MRRNKHLTKQVPDSLPLWVANITKVKLDKQFMSSHIDAYKKPYKRYWGPRVTVYQYDIRTQSGRTITTEYITARNPRQALTRIRVYWPSVVGVKLI